MMFGKRAFAGLWILAILGAGCATTDVAREPMEGHFLQDMMYMRDSTSARVSSWDRTGGNIDFRTMEPGDVLELADLEGAGCIRHIYFTIAGGEHYLRDLVLRAWWDGEDTPSVEVPFGDFFGLGHERPRFYRSLLVTVNVGVGKVAGTIGFNSYFPMPFADGAKLTLTNEGETTIGAVWYHIDYEKLDALDSNVGRFHAQWRRENLTTAVGESKNTTLHAGVNPDGEENYVILEAQGQGNLAGYFLNVDNVQGGWYGEGDDMIFIDGEEWPPSFHGTGSEEIFGGGACPASEYAGPYTGYHLVANPNFAGKVSMYRWFVTDAIRFQKSIKVTIEHGHANNYANDYSSTAFWYQVEPHAPFPELPDYEARRPRVGTDPHDQAFTKYNKLRTMFFSAWAAAQHKKVEIPPVIRNEVATFVRRDASDMFEEQDWAGLVEQCEEYIGVLTAFAEKHFAEEMDR